MTSPLEILFDTCLPGREQTPSDSILQGVLDIENQDPDRVERAIESVKNSS